MRKRSRLGVALSVMAVVVATMAAPASAHHVDLGKAEIDFGSCRELITTKSVAIDRVVDYVPDAVAAAWGDRTETDLVIRALKCRWVKASAEGHRTANKRPTIVQVGLAVGETDLPRPSDAVADETFTLFTVTDSPAFARGVRWAGQARVYVTDDVRFRMGHAEACGDRVPVVISVRGDRAPNFKVTGVAGAPGPDCEPAEVGTSVWWTLRRGVASALVYVGHEQAVVTSDAQLDVWAAHNTRMRHMFGVKHFQTDGASTGLIAGNAASPDAFAVPFFLEG